MNTFYWANAATGDGQKLWTYDSALTVDEALKVFEKWERDCGYRLKEMWVDVQEGDVPKARTMKVQRCYLVTEGEADGQADTETNA